MRKKSILCFYGLILVLSFSRKFSYAQGFSDSMSGTFDVVWEGGTMQGLMEKQGSMTVIKGGVSMGQMMGAQQKRKLVGKGHFTGNKIVVSLCLWSEEDEKNANYIKSQNAKNLSASDSEIAQKLLQKLEGKCPPPEQMGPYTLNETIKKDIYRDDVLIRTGSPFNEMSGVFKMKSTGMNPYGTTNTAQPSQPTTGWGDTQTPPSQPTGWGDTPQTQPQKQMGLGEMTDEKIMYYKRHFLDFKNPDYKKYEAKKEKDVNISGKKCEVYFYEPYYYGNRVVQREDTICDGWFPAKIYVTEYGEFGGVGGEFTMTLSNLKTGGTVDEALFEIPKDYKTMQNNSESQPMPALQTFKEVGQFPDLPGGLPYCDKAGPGHYIGVTIPLPGYAVGVSETHTFTCDWKTDMVMQNFYDEKFLSGKKGEGFMVSQKMAEKMTAEFQKKLAEEVNNVKTDEGKAMLKWWADALKKKGSFSATAFLSPKDEKGGASKVIYLAVIPEYKKEGTTSFVFIQPLDVISMQMQAQPKKGSSNPFAAIKNLGDMTKGTESSMAGMDQNTVRTNLEKDFAQ